MKSLSTSDLCNIFIVSRSTLFRWEHEGLIPTAVRNEKHERVYFRAHIKAVAKILYNKSTKKYVNSDRIQNDKDLLNLHQTRFVYKFLMGDSASLDDLWEGQQISPVFIEWLVKIALYIFAPGERDFSIIMDVVNKHSATILNE